jgi:hypothetical protein
MDQSVISPFFIRENCIVCEMKMKKKYLWFFKGIFIHFHERHQNRIENYSRMQVEIKIVRRKKGNEK